MEGKANRREIQIGGAGKKPKGKPRISAEYIWMGRDPKDTPEGKPHTIAAEKPGEVSDPDKEGLV